MGKLTFQNLLINTLCQKKLFPFRSEAVPDLVRLVAFGRKRVGPEACQLREAESLHTKPGLSSTLHGTPFKTHLKRPVQTKTPPVQTTMPDLVLRVAFGRKRVGPEV